MGAPPGTSAAGHPSDGRSTAQRRKLDANTAVDESESLGNLRELATVVLRRAMYAVSNGYTIDGRLRDSMRRVCNVAHNRSVTAERLVVLMKEAWWLMPEGERVLGHRREEVLARMVTLCIDTYFEPR